MLQRIQTLYLIAVTILTGILPFVFPLWTTNTGINFRFLNDPVYTILFGLSTTLTLVSILYFNKRQHQFVLNRLSVILNLILLTLFVLRSLNLSNESVYIVEKGIGMFLPIGAILFLVLANKAIKSDEDLVKSSDRLR